MSIGVSFASTTPFREELRIAIVTGSDYALLKVASERGFDAAEGIDEKTISVPDASEALKAIAEGRADAAALPTREALRDTEKDSSLVLFAGLEKVRYAVILRRWPKTKPISLIDLKSRTVVSAAGSLSESSFQSSAARAGFTGSDRIPLRSLPSVQAVIESVAEGRAGAGIVAPNEAAQAEKSGLIGSEIDVEANAARTTAHLVAPLDLLKSRIPRYAALLRALLRSQDYLNARHSVRSVSGAETGATPTVDPDIEGVAALESIYESPETRRSVDPNRIWVFAKPYRLALVNLAERFPESSLYHNDLYALGDLDSLPTCCR